MNFNETKVLYKFAQKTREGEMTWEKKGAPFEDFANSRLSERYATSFNGEALELSVESRVDTMADVDYHRSIIHLWVLDDNGDQVWRFPDNDALEDLLNTVRYQTGKVGDRLKRLMEG